MNITPSRRGTVPQKASAISQPCFQASAWYHATTLAERIVSLRAAQHSKPNLGLKADLAQQRMQRWRTQAPFTNDTYFAQRLKTDGISEAEFLHLLDEPIEAVKERFPDLPTWLAELTRAFSRTAASRSLPLPEVLQGQPMAGFLDAIEPLISQGCDRLREGVQVLTQTQTNLPFDLSTVEEMLFAKLPQQLLWMLSRTMVLELHVARLQGFLQGDTPDERFRSFLKRLLQRNTALALLQEYPVLARQLTICIDRWVTFSLEFLQHLCTDWDAIRTTFSPEDDPGLLVQYSRAGDSHQGGRAVIVAQFSSGFQLVYKPKSLAVDVHFQELLNWLNERGDHPPFQTLKILDCKSYGWVEFIAFQGCTSSEEIQRFYRRQGGYLALLYALRACDFHSENLIAAGEHPVLVDLESLFHPHVQGADITQSDLLARQAMAYSVLGVGLLPERLWTNAESGGIDISGLGGAEGQLTPDRIPYWEGAGTDEMQLQRQQMRMTGDHNRPTLNSIEVNVLDYTETLIDGFTNIYRLLLKYRNDLLSADGPLACFAEDRVRVILRHSYIYGLLQQESFHPDLLRNALERDRFFDKLWIGIEHSPYLAKVISAECQDLRNGDIPLFTTRPDSRDLWSSSNQRISGFLDESGIAVVQRRLQQLSDDDLAQQLQFIRASLATLAINAGHAQWKTYCLTEPQTMPDSEQLREQLLAAARSVGDRLEKLALRGEDDATWLSLKFIKRGYWSLVPLGLDFYDFYDEIPGVALFLAYLGSVTRDQRYTTLAQAALTTMRRQQERSKSSKTFIGGFYGWGAVIYTLTHLSALWHKPELLAEAEKVVELLPSLIEQDEELGIISGSAGCIGSLLSLYHCRPSQCTLAAAIQCGDQLIACAQPMEYGIGWVNKDAGKQPLTGFSYGAAGIAWALLELTTLTGEERFRTAALNAIAYERSLFSPKVGNWLDLREDETSDHAVDHDQHTYMTAWCHGAPGIGLARLRSLPHLDDPEIQAEIDTALKTTLAHGFGSNHSLCHGDLGNLELLLLASKTLDDPQWRSQVNRHAVIILESISRYGWLCGVPLRVETPGLMTGLAGIGYGLLRLAEPKRVPSVLVLAPPPCADLS